MGRSPLGWNLVVTAYGGRQHDLVYALRSIVRLQRAGFQEVLVGRTDDVEGCLAAIAARADATFSAEILARVVPVDRTFVLDAADLDAQLVSEISALLAGLVGHSFHVRVERRGQKGVVHSGVLERTLGTALVEALRSRGDDPRVTFRDPDVVVVVELIGTVGGVGLVPRALRARFPFVRT